MAQNINIPNQMFRGIIQLPNEQIGVFMKGIGDYIYNGIEPEFTNGLEYMFIAFRPFLEDDKNKYMKFIESRRNNPKGHGRPKKDWDNEQKAKKAKKATEIDIDKTINNTITNSILYNEEQKIKYKDIIEEFDRHWMEQNNKGIPKWKLQKTWSLSGRLATWYSNKQTNFGRIKPKELTNIELGQIWNNRRHPEGIRLITEYKIKEKYTEDQLKQFEKEYFTSYIPK